MYGITSTPRPTLLVDVLRAVVTHQLGELDADTWLAILAERKKVPAARWKSVVEDNEEHLKEALGEEEAAVAQAEIAAINEKKKNEKAGIGGASSSRGREREEGAGADGDQDEGAKKPKRAEFDEKHYTSEEASFFVPQVQGVSISLVRNRTWQGRYMDRLGTKKFKSKSITWEGHPDHDTHVKALVHVLKWIWDIHSDECKKEQCPFSLDIADW